MNSPARPPTSSAPAGLYGRPRKAVASAAFFSAPRGAVYPIVLLAHEARHLAAAQEGGADEGDVSGDGGDVRSEVQLGAIQRVTRAADEAGGEGPRGALQDAISPPGIREHASRGRGVEQARRREAPGLERRRGGQHAARRRSDVPVASREETHRDRAGGVRPGIRPQGARSPAYVRFGVRGRVILVRQV